LLINIKRVIGVTKEGNPIYKNAIIINLIVNSGVILGNQLLRLMSNIWIEGQLRALKVDTVLVHVLVSLELLVHWGFLNPLTGTALQIVLI